MSLKNQGGYVVLYFKSRLPISRRNITDIPIKYLVIKAVGNMTEDNKIATLKLENKSGLLFHPNYWLIVVDYEDKNSNGSEDINNNEKN